MLPTRPDDFKPGLVVRLITRTIRMGGDQQVINVANLRINPRHGPVNGRTDGQAQANFRKDRGGLVDLDGDVTSQEADGQNQAADAPADDGDGEWSGWAHEDVPLPKTAGFWFGWTGLWRAMPGPPPL